MHNATELRFYKNPPCVVWVGGGEGFNGAFLVFDLFLNIDLPQLDTDAEESAGGVCRRMPHLVGQVGLAVDGVPPPRLLRRAQLRRPFYDRRPVDHRYRRGEHRVRAESFTSNTCISCRHSSTKNSEEPYYCTQLHFAGFLW